MRYLTLIALACLLFVPHAAVAALKWERPKLENPITLDVTNISPAGLTQNLKPDQDYIIRLGATTDGRVARQSVTIIGGRNIQIIGGHLARPDKTPASDPKTGKRTKYHGVLLGVSSHTGTFYAEGLVLNANNQYGVDTIAVGAPKGKQPGKHILQNVHLRGVYGTSKGQHADGLQAVGPVETLWMHNVTVISACQGMVITPHHKLADVRLSNVNIRYADPDFRNAAANGFALWLGNGKNTREQVQATRYSFENVYVQPRTHYHNFGWAQSAIAPGRHMPKGNRPYNKNAKHAHFPEYNASGYITQGVPPGGDFVPLETLVDEQGRSVYGAAVSSL